MNYSAHILYIDEKSFKISMYEEDIEAFIECVKKGKCFFKKEYAKGVFIPYENVRYITVEAINAHKEGAGVLQGGDEDSEQGGRIAGEEEGGGVSKISKEESISY